MVDRVDPLHQPGRQLERPVGTARRSDIDADHHAALVGLVIIVKRRAVGSARAVAIVNDVGLRDVLRKHVAGRLPHGEGRLVIVVTDDGALEIAEIVAAEAQPSQRIADRILEGHEPDVVLPDAVIGAVIVGDIRLEDIFGVVVETAIGRVVLAIDGRPEHHLVAPAAFLGMVVEAVGCGDRRLRADQRRRAAPHLTLLVLHLEIADRGVRIGRRIGDLHAIVLADDVARIGVGGVSPAALHLRALAARLGILDRVDDRIARRQLDVTAVARTTDDRIGLLDRGVVEQDVARGAAVGLDAGHRLGLGALELAGRAHGARGFAARLLAGRKIAGEAGRGTEQGGKDARGQ